MFSAPRPRPVPARPLRAPSRSPPSPGSPAPPLSFASKTGSFARPAWPPTVYPPPRWKKPIVPPATLLHALQSRQEVAILATDPTIYEAESQLGAVPVLDACTGATANLPLYGYFTNAAYASQNASVVTAFRSALEKAQGDASMAAPLQTALTKSAGLQAQTAALVTLGIYPTTLSAMNIQRVANLMFFFNALGTTINVPSLVAK